MMIVIFWAGVKINLLNPSKMMPWWIIPVGNGNHMVNVRRWMDGNGFPQTLQSRFPNYHIQGAMKCQGCTWADDCIWVLRQYIFLIWSFCFNCLNVLPEKALDGRVFGISKNIKGYKRPLWTLWTRLYRRIFDLEKFPSQEIPIGKKERKMLWISLLESSSLNKSSHRQNRAVVPEIAFVWTWGFNHSCLGIFIQSRVSCQFGNPTNILNIVCKWLAMFVWDIGKTHLRAQQKLDLVSWTSRYVLLGSLPKLALKALNYHAKTLQSHLPSQVPVNWLVGVREIQGTSSWVVKWW